MDMTPTKVHGYAVVGDDDVITAADGTMPPALRNPADWRYFQAALDAAAVTVLGRAGHQSDPNLHGRNRLVVTSAATGIERRDDAWLWNPAAATLAAALSAAAPDGGRVAVVGGQGVFDLFLGLGYDAFHLTRLRGVAVPGGRRVFSACKSGTPAESVLRAAGLTLVAERPLDDAARLTLWMPGA
jgi:dihydrofolate reductase